MIIMFLQEICSILSNKLSPKCFKINSEVYGLQFDQERPNKIIKRGMLTFDVSIEAIRFAIRNKVNLVITYHSLIRTPTKKFDKNLIDKLTLLTKYPISIFVLSSSFIAAQGGVSDTLAEALYLNVDKTFEILNQRGIKVPIGRICSPKFYLNKISQMTLDELLKRIKTNLDLHYLLYVGNLKSTINRICLIGGELTNAHFLKKAESLECDCFISSKINCEDVIFGRDKGLTLIEVSDYKIKHLALKKLSNILSLEFPHIEFLFYESEDPFQISLR